MEPLWTGRPDPPPHRESGEGSRGRGCGLPFAALIMVLGGPILSYFSLALCLGMGDRGGLYSEWIGPIAFLCALAGLPIAIGGLIWFIYLTSTD
jgi:hypothetical protein